MVQSSEDDRVGVTGSRTLFQALCIQIKRSGAYSLSANNSKSQAAYNSHQQSFSVLLKLPVSLSPRLPFPGGFYLVSPHQLLKRDTGVYHLHLTYLRTACLLHLSRIADLAEPGPAPRHMIFYFFCIIVSKLEITVSRQHKVSE